MTIYESLPKRFPAEKTAVALGIFDGLHLGHMAVLTALTKASKADGCVPCVFTFNTTATRPDGKTAERLLSEVARNEILAGIGVHYVLAPDFSQFRDMAPEDFSLFLTQHLNAKAVFCGEDFKFGKGATAGAADLKAFLEDKAAVHVSKTVNALGGTVSATRIQQLLESGDTAAANKLLGHPFSIDAPVVYGRGIGRTLGLPTVNQIFPKNSVVPHFGVYASKTVVDEKLYASVSNIGVKPTV